jgi:ferritin-like metal-binding protein YciE
MRKTIKTLQDALTYQVQGLLYAEQKIGEAFKTCSHHLGSEDVKDALEDYVDNAGNVTIKLDRIFNYLLIEPIARKNEVILTMIEETQFLLTYTAHQHLKDILMIGCIKNINAYKTVNLQNCYLMAVELELDTVADLLQQILEWELAVGKRLASLSIHEFNKLNGPAKAN